MKKSQKFLALDFGASNGRAIIGGFDGKRIDLEEIHRFENRPVYLGGTFYWDFLRLFLELKTGITAAVKKFSRIESLGVETWGCDFGLLDKNKFLLSNPVHYRDKRTLGISDDIKNFFTEWDMYERTQAQILEINTICQLYSLKKSGSALLENAKHLLLLGDLFNFFLTGELICEFSNATLTQLLNQKERKWDKFIIDQLRLPEYIFSDITEPGEIIGKLNREILEEIGCNPIKVALPGYDTTSEITAIPVSKINKDKSWAYLNCGTWAMIGIVCNSPIVTEEGFKQGFGNEGGFNGKYHYLKNMVGLWIIQQCQKKWNEESDKKISWKDIDALTEKAENPDIFIDVDDQTFEREIFDMPACLISYCRNTGQQEPCNIGQICSMFYESLALKYLLNLKKLEKITGRKIELLHIVGGGSNNRLLCQWISDATGLPLTAGPAETTTTGNILAQMVATGAVKDIDEAREIMIGSVKLNHYLPDLKRYDFWSNKFFKYLKILSLKV